MTGTDKDDGGDGGASGRRPLPWLLGALVLARVGALAYLVLSHQERVDGGLAGDVTRYVQMATAQGTPYRDFQVEYPPVTYALIRLLSGADLARSIAAVAVSQFLCDLGIAGLLGWAWGRRAQMAYLILGLPLITFPFVYARIDLFSALLTVAGLAAVRKGWDRAGGVGLGFAVLAKLWPLAVAPVLLIERRPGADGTRAVARRLVAFVATGVVLTAVWFQVAGLDGFQQVLSFRDATGWQVESVPGILWHLHDPARIKFESGAFRTGVMPGWARPALTFISFALVGAAWWLAARRRQAGADDRVTFAEAPLAGVVALLLFAPILSPQYIVWMLPFAALLAAEGDLLVGGLAFAVSAVTTVSYVFVPAAAGGVLYGMLPVLVRNGLLVALLVVAFQSLAGVRAGAGCRAPGDAGPAPGPGAGRVTASRAA
jgi:hypothetical protein